MKKMKRVMGLFKKDSLEVIKMSNFHKKAFKINKCISNRLKIIMIFIKLKVDFSQSLIFQARETSMLYKLIAFRTKKVINISFCEFYLGSSLPGQK